MSPGDRNESRDPRGEDQGDRPPIDAEEEEVIEEEDIVGEASEDSFPASDAPGWTKLSVGSPKKRRQPKKDRAA